MTSGVSFSTRFLRTCLLITFGIYGLAVIAFPGPDTQVVPAASRTILSASSVEPGSLLHDALTSENGFVPQEGRWLFPDMPWTISQSAPRPLSADSETLLSDHLTGSEFASLVPGEFDGHLLGLITSLMRAEPTSGDLQTYTVDSAEFRGSALSVKHGQSEVPVLIRIAWPAHNDLWTVVEAVRRSDSEVPKPLLNLPDGVNVVATRIGSDGSAQCHLISRPAASDALREQFRSLGWKVEKPPGSTGLAGLFWLTSGTERLEVSVRSSATNSGSSAIIRRI